MIRRRHARFEINPGLDHFMHGVAEIVAQQIRALDALFPVAVRRRITAAFGLVLMSMGESGECSERHGSGE
jgi:hypothetical protein